MALSESEIQSLRHHLGFGNITTGAYPYTPDGFFEFFQQVIAPNLQTGTQTSATTAITAGSTVQVTPLVMTDIVPYARLVVDVGEDAEIVTVKAVTATTFTAKFAKAHAASGYPVALLTGEARLRLLMHSADRTWEKLQSAGITNAAGLKSIGQGEVEWFPGGAILRGVAQHYLSIVNQISQLVRVQHVWEDVGSSGCAVTEPH